MTASRTVSREAQATLAFARELLTSHIMIGGGSDTDTVFEPALISGVWWEAEFTVSVESGTFRVNVERIGRRWSGEHVRH